MSIVLAIVGFLMIVSAMAEMNDGAEKHVWYCSAFVVCLGVAMMIAAAYV